MSSSDRLLQIAHDLRERKSVPSVTVSEFLLWFGAQRRGYYVVENIRRALREAGLVTSPDFESAYIHALITFSLASEAPIEKPRLRRTVAPGTANVPGSTADTVYDDPTYRISKLAAANSPPTSVVPDATASQAVTLMLANDFSQLPVMTNEREVKGVVSWTSIGTRLSLGKNGSYVRDLMDTPHQEIHSDASIFAAIPVIVQHQYVLVRGDDKRITGIVTASDLSLQFQQLAEPFLLLGEIENHIRRIIASRFSNTELVSALDPADTDREINGVDDLTMGEYKRFLDHPGRWDTLSLRIDRTTFGKYLDRVRNIRNEVMHFDPDPLSKDDLDWLRSFTRFLQRLQEIGVP